VVDCGEEDEGGDGDIPGDEGERLSGRGRHPEHGLAIPLPGRIDVCDEGLRKLCGRRDARFYRDRGAVAVDAYAHGCLAAEMQVWDFNHVQSADQTRDMKRVVSGW